MTDATAGPCGAGRAACAADCYDAAARQPCRKPEMTAAALCPLRRLRSQVWRRTVCLPDGPATVAAARIDTRCQPLSLP